MPITISYQNNNDSLNVAYRPVVFRCKARISGATPLNYIPPVVYCDVYINGIYYKSLSKTTFINNDLVAPEYEFDVQDAIQEIMSYNLPAIDGSNVLSLTKTVKKVFVKFRNAKYDVNGFITSEQLPPIQGTSTSAPVSGNGFQSNEIYVFNATLQHEDVQDFATFLDNFKTGFWDGNSYPLTKRPKKMKLCNDDSSYFPIATAKTISCLELNYRNKNSNVFQSANYCYPVFIYTMNTPLSKAIIYDPDSLNPIIDHVFAFSVTELIINVINSQNNATVGLKIYSLPNRGSITDQGWDVPVGYTIPVTQLNLGTIDFWVKGSQNQFPNGDYSTSFTYRGVDSQGNESNLVTFTITADDITINANYISQISWHDTQTFEDRFGNAGPQKLWFDDNGILSMPPSESLQSRMWQKNVGAGWIDFNPYTSSTILTGSILGINKYRLKHIGNFTIWYSNVLKFTGQNGSGSGSGSSGGSSSGGGGSSSGGSGSGSDGSGGSGGSGPDGSGS